MSITNGWMDIGNVDGVLFAIECLSHNESEFIEFVFHRWQVNGWESFIYFHMTRLCGSGWRIPLGLWPLRRYPHFVCFLCITFVLFELYLFACESCPIGNTICLHHPQHMALAQNFLVSKLSSAQHFESSLKCPREFHANSTVHNVRFIRFDWRRQVISKHMINDIPFLMQNSSLLNKFDCRRFK